MRLKLRLLEAAAEDSLLKFEQAQVEFQTAKEKIIKQEMRTRGTAKSDAEYTASQHPQVKEAAGDCAYFRDRATMYGTLAIMMRMRQQAGE